LDPASLALVAAMVIAAILIGGTVGACELIGRYKDAPFEAIRNPAALGYIAVNAFAALLAYVLIVKLDWTFGTSGTAAALAQLGVGGFGAMAFFRSSLFNIKVGTTDVAVGPAILFQILLFATDREVDRDRGDKRSESVPAIMKGVSFDLAREGLPTICFELLQNVPVTEQQQFRLVVDALASKTSMSDSMKALSLGLMLMNVVGRDVLEAAVKRLGVEIQGASELSVGVVRQLARVSYTKSYPTLVDICFVLSKYGTPDEQRRRQDEVTKEGDKLKADVNLDNATKVLMLALSLQQRVGDYVLSTALTQLGNSLYADVVEPAEQNVPEPANDEAKTGAPAPEEVSGAAERVAD
jgi:hypothetical protein